MFFWEGSNYISPSDDNIYIYTRGFCHESQVKLLIIVSTN